MSTYRLARPLLSPSLLTESAAGLSESGKPVLVLRRKEPWAQAPGFFERFAFTQQGWQSLRQADGVVPLIEVGQADGVTYLVQEFFECEPLRLALQAALMTQQKFSPLESVAVVLQAARGLLALDQATPSLAHGDVSASTLLFGSDGQVKLEAIGVASMHPADTQLGPARSELLTLSPEELEGRGGAPSDIFHLGLLWLELLTSKTAFGGATHAEVKARFEKFPGVTPGHFPGLPQPIPMVLAMMLSKVPSARPTISDLELMLTQVFTSLEGGDSPAQVLVPVFARLFPERAPVAPQLQGEGSTPLTLTPASGPAAPPWEGQVPLGRITTKRMSLTDVTAVRLEEEADGIRAAAREWSNRHQRDEGNPRDFALGGALLEAQKLTMKQLDQALLHAQSLGATMFDSLVALDVLDEDAVLPIAAGLMKQAYLTGPQLLELQLGPAQAPLLSRDVADDWQVIPLKLEAGSLQVAMADPSRGDVLDDVKTRAKVRFVTAVRATERTIQEGYARIYEGKTHPPEWAQPMAPVRDALELLGPPLTVRPPFDDDAWGPVPVPAAPSSAAYEYKGSSDSSPMVKGSSPSGELHAFSPSPYEFGAGPMLPFSPPPQPMPPMPAAPVPLPGPRAPPSIAPVVAAVRAPAMNSELAGSLDVALRMLEALFSVNGERGLEASAMIALVRSVAKQAGATGAPLDQVRLSVASVVIAALLEGKRAWEVPSRPAAAACLGPYWHDFEDFIRPLIDGDETLPSDPRGVVLCLCFEVANQVGAVPSRLSEAKATLNSLRNRYPPAALAALEIVLAGQ